MSASGYLEKKAFLSIKGAFNARFYHVIKILNKILCAFLNSQVNYLKY